MQLFLELLPFVLAEALELSRTCTELFFALFSKPIMPSLSRGAWRLPTLEPDDGITHEKFIFHTAVSDFQIDFFYYQAIK